MSIQAPEDSSSHSDPYSGLSKSPVFSRKGSDYAGQQVKPLGQVYYEGDEDEHLPLLSDRLAAFTVS